MRIGILPSLEPSQGGIYQYSLTMLSALDAWRHNGCKDEFVVFAEGYPRHIPLLNQRGWVFKPPMPLPPPSLLQKTVDIAQQIVGEGPHRDVWRWLRLRSQRLLPQGKSSLPNPDVVQYRPEAKRWFNTCGVELMIYPTPNALSFEAEVSYIVAIHDLQHRLQPEFPEVSANGEWESREYYFRNGARYAMLILADSEVGKEDILSFYAPYGVTPDRVKVLPFLPTCYLSVDVSTTERERVRTAYRLPERYLFYPAQFWPHKNHSRIVQALGLLKQGRGLNVPIVFCGSYGGKIREHTFREVMLLAAHLGLEKQIHYLGYVPDEFISGIYAEAVALVMPTFFGPTNIPILEAWAFGCPVLTSDIRGIREQVQNAAILVDPRSVEAIAEGIYRLWTDESLTRTLADLGKERLASYTPDDYRRRLVGILEDAKTRLQLEKRKSAQELEYMRGAS